MADEIEVRKSVERSPNFPFITLEVALERASQFYEKEKRGSAPFAIAAQHWRYSPSSSGALQTAGALKSYGLMIDEGGGSSRKLKLTDLALRILLDARPESPEREQYKRQAALAPSVVADIYQKWESELPSEATLNHYLVLDRGFNQSTALRAVKILFHNQDFTKSSTGDFESVDDQTMEQPVQHNQLPEVSNWASKGAMQVPKGAMTPQTNLENAEWVMDANNKKILIQFVEPPTIEAYEFLKDYFDLRIKVLTRAEKNAAAKGKEKTPE
jgi:hypothetical protein